MKVSVKTQNIWKACRVDNIELVLAVGHYSVDVPISLGTKYGRHEGTVNMDSVVEFQLSSSEILSHLSIVLLQRASNLFG